MKKFVFRTLLTTKICILITQFAFAQVEGGISIGAMQYEGDIGGRFPAGPNQLHNPTSTPGLAVGLEVGYKISTFLKVRASLNFGTIYGNDRKIDTLKLIPSLNINDKLKAERNYDRGLNFKSPINEIFIGTEIYPLSIINSSTQAPFQPYLILGVGVFNFNPKAQWRDTLNDINSWVELKPLRTEGQGILKDFSDPNSGYIKNEYKLVQTNFAIGLGFKYNITSAIGIAYELLFRRTSTDYLDDASGKYIDIDIYNTYFNTNPRQKDQARQLSNTGLYYKDDTRLIGDPTNFNIGNTRGGRLDVINDYYYTNSIKLTFNLGRNENYRGSSYKSRRSQRCPTVY